MNPKSKVILTASLGVIWAGAAVFGGHALLKYESSPGKIGDVPSAWPVSSSIQLASDRPTLVMFAHPQCPCTRASIDELAQIVARVQAKPRVYVLFYTPHGSIAEWENTDSRRSAAQIPSVTVLSDLDGAEAERFGAQTSGHTLLFDPTGRLLFNGGITASRGHSGDNAGESSIVSLIENRTPWSAQTSVFGCSIKNYRSDERKCSK